jgi:hypothetical protein
MEVVWDPQKYSCKNSGNLMTSTPVMIVKEFGRWVFWTKGIHTDHRLS